MYVGLGLIGAGACDPIFLAALAPQTEKPIDRILGFIRLIWTPFLTMAVVMLWFTRREFVITTVRMAAQQIPTRRKTFIHMGISVGLIAYLVFRLLLHI
jgi:hypothetical protein